LADGAAGLRVARLAARRRSRQSRRQRRRLSHLRGDLQAMNAHAIRGLITDVERGRLSRRAFVQTMVGLGVAAPLASQMLGGAGVASAQPSTFTPTKRGGGGV